MIFCSKCGTNAEDQSNFCTSCGSELRAQRAPQAESRAWESHKTNGYVQPQTPSVAKAVFSFVLSAQAVTFATLVLAYAIISAILGDPASMPTAGSMTFATSFLIIPPAIVGISLGGSYLRNLFAVRVRGLAKAGTALSIVTFCMMTLSLILSVSAMF